jgi:hypothetical protein
MAVNLELFNTCMFLAGIVLPDNRVIDCKDLLPLLKGQAATPHEAFYY